MHIVIPLALLLLLALGAGSYTGVVPVGPRRIAERRKSDLMTFDVDQFGVVFQTPAQIQTEISRVLKRPVSLDVVALATAMASESTGPELAQIGIGWAIKNYAAKNRSSVVATVSPDGRFAKQGTRNHGYVSSKLPPTRKTIELAEKIMPTPPKIADPTSGAIQFDSPKAQRALLARGEVKDTPEEIAARRIKAGRRLVTLPGVSSENVRFWV